MKVPVDSDKAADSGEDIKLSLPQKAKALAQALPPAYWQALIVVSLLYFARFDASFITLRAKTVSSSQTYLTQHKVAVACTWSLSSLACSHP